MITTVAMLRNVPEGSAVVIFSCQLDKKRMPVECNLAYCGKVAAQLTDVTLVDFDFAKGVPVTGDNLVELYTTPAK